MAMSSRFCLNLSQGPSGSNLTSRLPKTIQLQPSRSKKETSWRSQCVLGLACVIINLEAGDSSMLNQEKAFANDTKIGVESNGKMVKWSDKRECPPWQVHSLESIVPENLPRPSARRKWEAVGYSKRAPSVKESTTLGCFSM